MKKRITVTHYKNREILSQALYLKSLRRNAWLTKVVRKKMGFVFDPFFDRALRGYALHALPITKTLEVVNG